MKNKKKKLNKTELHNKQGKTLKKMKEIRKNDFIFLRKTIEGKLDFANAQKVKAEQSIELATQTIEQNTVTLYKLVGMIMVLNELLEEKTEEEKANINKRT